VTDIDDQSAVFDPDVLATTASEYGLTTEDLSDVVDRHQESMAALPGIENLAYEWRKQYESPLIERTAVAYHFAVPEWVWDEFGDALDVRERHRDALAEVHRRTVADSTDVEPEPSGDLTYVTLVRAYDDAGTL
jgi:hypothetical protein